MTKDKDEAVKELLEDWQDYQHMGDYDLADEIEDILLKYHNIDMTDWEYWLRKYHLIKER